MYTGQGGFWKSMKKYGKKAWNSGLGKRMRSFAADELAMAAGGFVPGAGGPVRDALRKSGLGMYTGEGMYTGSGAYDKVVSNDLIAGGHETEGIMRFDTQNDEDSITISHSEYVMDVYAPSANKSKADIKLPLNAGSSKTFPMLSQIAGNFEDFKIIQLGFTYKPSLSDWQTTNGQVGQVLLATNYNPTAELWTSKQQLLAQTGSTSARTIDTTFHGVECDSSKTHNDGHYLVRTGPPRPDADLNDYDHGWTQLAVVDTPTGSPNITLGELHVSYTIKLSKPRVWQKAGNIIPRDIFQKWDYDSTTGSWDLVRTDSTQTYFVPRTQDFIYEGRQNNIGAKLERFSATGFTPAALNHDYLSVTLPANLSGDFYIRVTAKAKFQNVDSIRLFFKSTGSIKGLANQQDLTNVPGAPDESNTGADYFRPQEEWIQQDKGTMPFLAGFGFRVDVARDGVDNRILILVGQIRQQGAQTAISMNSIKIELTGLNTRLQWRQDGQNDKIIFIDQADQIVTY